jgi:hypothetical protein
MCQVRAHPTTHRMKSSLGEITQTFYPIPTVITKALLYLWATSMVPLYVICQKLLHLARVSPRASPDDDPLFQYHRWEANLRELDIKEIKFLTRLPHGRTYLFND